MEQREGLLTDNVLRNIHASTAFTFQTLLQIGAKVVTSLEESIQSWFTYEYCGVVLQSCILNLITDQVNLYR